MWTEHNDKLTTNLKFQDFASCFAFMTEAALWIEKMDHHPTWTNTYNNLEIILTTHDVGNKITEKDRKLAQHLEKIVGKYLNSK